MAVGKLRSHADKQVSELAKEVVKKWKTEVDKSKRTTEVAKPPAGAQRKSSAAIATSSKAAPATPAAPKKPTLRTTKTDGISTTWTDDKTRNKCAELIYDALASDSGARKYHAINLLVRC